MWFMCVSNPLTTYDAMFVIIIQEFAPHTARRRNTKRNKLFFSSLKLRRGREMLLTTYIHLSISTIQQLPVVAEKKKYFYCSSFISCVTLNAVQFISLHYIILVHFGWAFPLKSTMQWCASEQCEMVLICHISNECSLIEWRSFGDKIRDNLSSCRAMKSKKNRFSVT